jgi:hypothetical protein
LPLGNLLAIIVTSRSGKNDPEPVEVWELATGQKAATTTRLHGQGIAFGSEDEVLVSVRKPNRTGRDQASELWTVDRKSGEGKKERDLQLSAGPFGLSPDGKYLAFTHSRQTRLVERSTGKEVWNGDTPQGVLFSPGMQLLAVPAGSHSLRLLRVGGLFHPRWADAAAALANLRSSNVSVSLCEGRIQVSPTYYQDAVYLSPQFRQLAGITHLSLSIHEGANKEHTAPLALLKDLEELTISYAYRPGRDFLEPIRGLEKLRSDRPRPERQ